MVTDEQCITFIPIEPDDLDSVVGGFDLSSLGNLNFGQLGQTIGGLFEAFKSKSASGIGGGIGSLIDQFKGLFGGAGGQQQMQAGAAPQQGGAQPDAQQQA
jgi:hypothetical protein